MANQMSLEAAIDEERKEVLALLEGNPGTRKRGSASSAASGRAPRSPVRSMLDVAEDDALELLGGGTSGTRSRGSASSASGRAPSPFIPQSPVRSMLDIAENSTSRHSRRGSTNGGTPGAPRTVAVRSMLDISAPPPAAATTVSASNSPTQSNHRSSLSKSKHQQHRSLSDVASHPADFGPRSNVLGAAKPSPNAAYQFSGYLPSNPGGPVVPKRNTQAGRKGSMPSAMAEVVRGGDLSTFGTREKPRNHSIAGTGIGAGSSKSRSPHNTLGGRTKSPHVHSDTSKFVTNDGRTIDMNNAYRRLSDANLAKSGGDLSLLPKKTRRRTNSDGIDPLSGGRLEKDYTALDGDDAIDSSDEEERSSDEDYVRGRRKTVSGQNGESLEHDPEGSARPAMSLMAAAEEERQVVAGKQKVKSLLDPEITVTGPSGNKLKSSKPGVHPNTSYDEVASGYNTPADSDAEAELTDIKRAQKLQISMTPIVSTPATSRCVRTIYRGDWARMQEEAHDNQRRIRKYLCATDLSDEAAHALEWTVGTVLRDGDTLLCVYCVDEEVGIGEANSGDDAQMKEQAAAVAASTRASGSTPLMSPVPQPSPLTSGFRLDSLSASPMGREKSKAEQERYRAVKDITERVSKLLRKTKLQVKVVIEVIHCKSPKHLITEIIDFISPTLAIMGSRGRSNLKGVILGSFSNYLVTKSSVPVMVARKKLKKHTKYKRPTNIRLANNLNSPSTSLAGVKIHRID
ncbi:Uncharacterized protein LSUE1_G006426 [Lachnellula suecica]|uniref:UspA domain-containing protein n=1 Tax=Lachnellula suecica TaxID=602035 RepID=A0A8T9BZJ7_9HELO|nr:Uncharacterized protein LSUE1_G006426 [Lachnellula suecica]